MKFITSKDNLAYKKIKILATQAHARRKAEVTLLDGVHLCQTYLEKKGSPRQCIIDEAFQNNAEVQTIIVQCLALSVPCLVLPSALYQPLAQIENGVGLLFLIEKPTTVYPTLLNEGAVFLDRVQDPGNLGSIIRSAAASGISHIYCGIGTAQVWSPRVLRAGMGGHFSVNIYENVDLKSCISTANIPVLATSPYQAKVIYEIDLQGDVVWLLGNEGQGVSEELLALSTQRVMLPQYPNVESLNVAACAAVCFFEQLRQKNQIS